MKMFKDIVGIVLINAFLIGAAALIDIQLENHNPEMNSECHHGRCTAIGAIGLLSIESIKFILKLCGCDYFQ